MEWRENRTQGLSGCHSTFWNSTKHPSKGFWTGNFNPDRTEISTLLGPPENNHKICWLTANHLQEWTIYVLKNHLHSHASHHLQFTQPPPKPINPSTHLCLEDLWSLLEQQSDEHRRMNGNAGRSQCPSSGSLFWVHEILEFPKDVDKMVTQIRCFKEIPGEKIMSWIRKHTQNIEMHP